VRLPLVPATSASSAARRRAGGTVPARATEPRNGRGRLLLGVVLFIAGFTVVFVAMGVLAGTLGRFFVQYQGLTRVLGVVVIAMGLVFLGCSASRSAHEAAGAQRSRDWSARRCSASRWASAGRPASARPTRRSSRSRSPSADPWRAALLAVAYSLGLGIPFLLLAVGFGWATRSVAFLRRHIRAVNIIGGVLLVVLGVLMVTGVWTASCRSSGGDRRCRTPL
jgi:cytochrome c-type biogenesis protein